MEITPKKAPGLDWGKWAAIAVIAAAIVLIAIILFLLFRPTETAASAYSDNADYSLTGQLRVVVTQTGNGINMRSEPNGEASVAVSYTHLTLPTMAVV